MYAKDDLLKAMKHYQKLYLKLSENVRNTYSISQTEFDVIAFLNNHPQCSTAKEICEIRMLTKSNVSVAVDNLTKMGMIACKTDEQDRRIIRLKFMPEADRLRNDVKIVQEEFGQVLFKGISREEIDNLFGTLSKMSRNAETGMEENRCGR